MCSHLLMMSCYIIVMMSLCIISQVIQLTGFSDPVYAEAYVLVNQYDIALDVLVVNQTSDTLQGLTLELATLGKRAYGSTSKCAV